MANLDHMILAVRDLRASLDFYTDLLAFGHEGKQGPFDVVRIDDGFVLLLAEVANVPGTVHLGFNLTPPEFARAFEAVKARGIPFGDQFDATDNGRGPSPLEGANGALPAFYVLDPSGHLIELREGA